MAKRKSKLTPTQQEYRRERQRIQRQINRMTNRGYDVPELLPKIPKKITEASVRRLKKITTEKLYKESRFIRNRRNFNIKGRASTRAFQKEKAKTESSSPSPNANSPTRTRLCNI